MKPLAECRLYTFVDTAYLHGRRPEVVAQQLCDGGSDLIQLRAKDASPDDVRKMAEKIIQVTRRAGVRLVINDYPRIARDAGAELCHLGQEDFFDAGYRHVCELSNRDFEIGLSTHAPEQARRAMEAGPAYLAVGPVFATETKPTAKAVTLEYVRWAAASVEIPWFAIGGINLQTMGDVLAAGAKRICVVSAILNAPDVTKACLAFRDRLE